MPSKLTNIRRIFVLLAALWFAGYVSATTVCANTCPDCVSVSLNSCSASCSAVSVPSHAEVKVKFAKLDVLRSEIALLYASVNTVNIWKPPKQAVPSELQLVI
jgi:hypothetical protein